MKKIYILLITLFVINGAMAQWYPQNSGTTRNLYSVFFSDPNTGYVVGDSGTILKTIDGGLNWIQQNSDTTSHLKSVFFTDANNGYAVGDCLPFNGGGTILKTIDGGATWSTYDYWNGGYSIFFKSVQFTDASTGYIFGKESAYILNNLFIIKTEDSGANWSKIWSMGASSEGFSLGSMFFSGPDTGYVVHTDYAFMEYDLKLYKTTDGWANWQQYNIDHGNGWYGGSKDIYFTDADTGYIGGSPMWKTTDGGITWSGWLPCYVDGPIFFINTNTGWAANEEYLSGNPGEIIHTTDGGQSWMIQSSGVTVALHRLFFINENIGYAVGDSGTIIRTTNGGGSPAGIYDQNSTPNYLKIYPNPSLDIITVETIEKGHLSILNLNGQEVITHQITGPKTQIDINNLANGIFVVKLVKENGVQMGKIIKQ